MSQYNLKHWISALIGAFAIAPFLYFKVKSEDFFDYFAAENDFLEPLFAALLVFPIFLAIALNRKVATFCARDKGRIDETIKTARTCSVLVGLILVMSIAFYGWFVASN